MTKVTSGCAKQMTDLCSVIIPVHNSEAYVEEALRSALNQTYKNLEIIIIDDASTDSSPAIIQRLLPFHRNIRVITLQDNKGTAHARNLGLQVATGKYIAFLDSDDIWRQDKISEQIQILKNSENDLSFTAYDMIDEATQLIKHRSVKKTISFSDLLKENSVVFSSVVCKAGTVRNELFDEEVFHEDYLFLLKLLQKGKRFYGLNQNLLQYRVHSFGKSFDKRNAARQRWKIYRTYLHMGFFKSLYYFACYAFHGVMKYI